MSIVTNEKLERAKADLASRVEFHLISAMEAPDFPSKEYQRGNYDALRSVKELIENLTADEDDRAEVAAEAQEATDNATLSISNRDRTPFFRG